MRIAAIVIAICTLTMTGFGCGGGSKDASEQTVEKTIEDSARAQGNDVDVDISGDSVSIKTEDNEGNEVTVNSDNGQVVVKSKEGSFATFTGEDGALPEGFPTDVPVYPGVKIVSASSMTENETFSIQATTPDAVDAVLALYKKELKDKGWDEVNVMTQSGQVSMHMLNYSKDSRNLMVIITSEDSQTSIAITTMKEQ